MKKSIDLFLVVSKHCNLSCSYCYVDKAKREHQYLYDDTAIKNVDRFIEKCKQENQAINKITLHGSETTILSAEVLGEIVNKLHTLCNRVSMQTNGVNFADPKYVSIFNKTIKYKRRVSIGISMDGHKTIHDHNRDNSYEKAYMGIINLFAQGYKLGTLGVITSQTIKELDQLKHWIEHMKVCYGIDPSFQFENGVNALDVKDQRTYLTWARENGYLKTLSTFRKNYANQGNGCKQLVFDIDGNVFGCNKHYGGDDAFASWYKDSFEIIIKKRDPLFNIKDYAIDEECKSCSFYSFCHGGCPVTRINNKANDCFSKKFIYGSSSIEEQSSANCKCFGDAGAESDSGDSCDCDACDGSGAGNGGDAGSGNDSGGVEDATCDSTIDAETTVDDAVQGLKDNESISIDDDGGYSITGTDEDGGSYGYSVDDDRNVSEAYGVSANEKGGYSVSAYSDGLFGSSTTSYSTDATGVVGESHTQGKALGVSYSFNTHHYTDTNHEYGMAAELATDISESLFGTSISEDLAKAVDTLAAIVGIATALQGFVTSMTIATAGLGNSITTAGLVSAIANGYTVADSLTALSGIYGSTNAGAALAGYGIDSSGGASKIRSNIQSVINQGEQELLEAQRKRNRFYSDISNGNIFNKMAGGRLYQSQFAGDIYFDATKAPNTIFSVGEDFSLSKHALRINAPYSSFLPKNQAGSIGFDILNV